MVKRGHIFFEKRTAEIDAFLLQNLKAPGPHPIEQVELYKKFRPFVPFQYWDETCPRPSDGVISRFKDESA
jgi:hypothetical protein